MIPKKALWVAALTASLPAQSIVPAKAGLVSYADEAYVDDRPVEVSATHFFALNENALMLTRAGRAEVLLGPCAAMWIDAHSSFRMVSNALSDTRIELLSGSAIVASGEMVRGSRLTLLLKTSVAPLNPRGAYRFDSEPARIKVLAGATTVLWANQAVSVTAGRLLLLDGLAPMVKFDRRNPEPLEDWSNLRAAFLARLSGQNGKRPEPPVTPDVAPVSPRGANKGGVPATPPMAQLPAPGGSGCGVTAW